MIKALVALAAGIIVIGVGIAFMTIPGTKGNTGGGGIILVGVFIALRGLRLLVKGGGGVPITSSRGSGTSSGRLFSSRRVIEPHDSRPSPPFKL